MWIKELNTYKTFKIFLLLEQIKEYNNSRNVTFQVIFISNWQGAVIFQLRNKRPKELLHEPIYKIYLINLNFEVKV